MKDRIRTMTAAAMFAALTCVATMIIKIPSPMKGYLNMGDCMVLLSGWMLPPGYGFLAAGLGSALADMLCGYGVYVPATFAIKAMMAIAAHYSFRRLQQRCGLRPARIIAGMLAEITMVFGYFVFESVLYTAPSAALNVIANCVQGGVGMILGIVLAQIFEKAHINIIC